MKITRYISLTLLLMLTYMPYAYAMIVLNDSGENCIVHIFEDQATLQDILLNNNQNLIWPDADTNPSKRRTQVNLRIWWARLPWLKSAIIYNLNTEEASCTIEIYGHNITTLTPLIKTTNCQSASYNKMFDST